MDALLDKSKSAKDNGVHLCVSSSARIEVALLLKLTGMNAASLVVHGSKKNNTPGVFKEFFSLG